MLRHNISSNLESAIEDSEEVRRITYRMLHKIISTAKEGMVDSPLSIEENIDKIHKATGLYMESVRVQRCLQNWLNDTSKPTQV